MTSDSREDPPPFSMLLRRYRVVAGLSQEELAERARMSARGISDLERGVRRTPHRGTVAQLAEALELAERDRAALEDAAERSRQPSTGRQEPGPAHPDPLLATKLEIPPARAALVPRPHLIERLEAGLHGPLTLMSAPAGSGKSTLLSAWRATREGEETPLAWVSIDAADNDPTRFWRYVLTALDRAVPGVARPILRFLDSAGDLSMEAVLTRLVNALSAHGRDVVLMLDDYHAIENQSIHDALAFLLEHLPPCLHLLLATRADPPLPLARLRGRGNVTELRAADLRFTLEDTGAFLNTVMGLSLSSEDVDALEARTEGWIAGIQLAALSLEGRSPEDAAAFVANFAGSHRYIVDYLFDEVLLRQPEEVQRFLLHTCMLDRLCAPLCATVIEGEDPSAEATAAGQELLEWLERHNVFLIALDDDRRWYRYHQLFADALRQRQKAAVPDVALLHGRASVWLEQEGLLQDAVGHALAAQDFDRAADLVTRLAHREVFGWALGRDWIQALPDAVLRSRPQLCVLRAWFLIDVCDLDTAEQYLQQAEAVLATWAAENARNLRGEIAAARATIGIWSGDASGMIEQAEIALRSLDDSKTMARSVAMLSLGHAHMSQGAARAAAQAFHETAMANRAMSNGSVALMGTRSEAHAYRALGAWTRAISLCEEAITWSTERSHPSPIVGELYLTLADLLRERGQPNVALEHATRGLNLCAELGVADEPLWRTFGRLLLARIKQAQGDLDGSLAVVGEAREQLQGPTAPFAPLLAAFETQVHLSKGDVESAARWWQRAEAEGSLPGPKLVPLFSLYAYEYLAIAPVQLLLAQGRDSHDSAALHRALQIIDEQRQEAEHLGFLWRHVKALALRALALQALGHGKDALATLEQALTLAQPEGYVGLFVDEGPPMGLLLRQLSAHTRLASYVAALLSTLGDEQVPDIPAAVPRRGGLEEPLTERELDVLRLLAAGQSNPEIARTLYVELNTVKTHVKHLYDKLGVHSRDQAVWRARELTLI